MNNTGSRASNAVLLDACALVPMRLANTLLWLAEAGLFELLWSEQILLEVQRSLPKLGISEEKAARRIGNMRTAFGESALVAGYDHLIAQMGCDPKDRHVLAAAVHAEAELLVTFNLKDFPSASTAPYGVSALHPDEFLSDLLEEQSANVLDALRRGCSQLRNPPQTLQQFLVSLAPTVPRFAAAAASAADRF